MTLFFVRQGQTVFVCLQHWVNHSLHLHEHFLLSSELIEFHMCLYVTRFWWDLIFWHAHTPSIYRVSHWCSIRFQKAHLIFICFGSYAGDDQQMNCCAVLLTLESSKSAPSVPKTSRLLMRVLNKDCWDVVGQGIFWQTVCQLRLAIGKANCGTPQLPTRDG